MSGYVAQALEALRAMEHGRQSAATDVARLRPSAECATIVAAALRAAAVAGDRVDYWLAGRALAWEQWAAWRADWEAFRRDLDMWVRYGWSMDPDSLRDSLRRGGFAGMSVT